MAEGTRSGEMPSFEPSHSFEAQKRRFSSDGSELSNKNAPRNYFSSFCECVRVGGLKLKSETVLLVIYVF